MHLRIQSQIREMILLVLIVVELFMLGTTV
jgi:hypothetical protein